MNSPSARALFVAPRAICIFLIAFVSMFALDVFDEDRGFAQTAIALAIHLVPSFVMLAALVIAWRREWVGTVAFAGCALVFFLIVQGPWWGKTMFTLPCLLAAWLFLLNWLERKRRHAAAA